VADHLVRVGYLLQGAPASPRLTTGLTAGFRPQRLRRRLGQPVRGRWLRGVPRICRHLPLQLGDPGILHRDMSPQLNHQIGEFLIGRSRHKPIVSQNNITSAQHADEQRDQLQFSLPLHNRGRHRFALPWTFRGTRFRPEGVAEP